MTPLRRTTAAAASTAAGFVLVLAAHVAGSRPAAAGSPSPASAQSGSAQSGSAQSGSAQSGPAQSGSGQSPSTAPATSSGTARTSPGSPASGQLASAVGANEQYGYGALSVRAAVRGRRIVDLSVVNLQTAEQYSQSIAQQVIPVLRREVLAAQNLHVNAISGATYTTEAYLYSAQSALTKLHF
jgi:uncharacterized protein with FMN-binding domain